ncbi:DNA-deoxyinosine glycosylase [Brevundimonas sp. Leaf363]|uniref:DNA-deoxyinosine glycosylase n=1 Tax=Brevundimonas sp. Leaf363 TaxID=1736353 RepID=UPI0006FAB09C|nr:DNA-deoxyinosine glycosylase [Brevundimonas sp. Leaf363]KQS55544.1 DNA-deoxyinosine glycosylase [Brevundimonas sp. Leaf363]
MTERASHFPPVVTPDTRLLILGSLPGDASLKAAQYYAHPQNALWRLIGGVLGEDLAQQPYAHRLERLKARGVGLWDVIASAERTGSLDTAIRLPVHADLPGLIATLPNLRAVAFNGGKAAQLGRRILGDRSDLTLIDLPSSSPALTKPFAWKAESWAVLAAFLPDRRHP